jgi:heptosyltransferase-3
MKQIPSSIRPKRILICQLRQIGDVLLSTPAIRLVAERFPEAALHVLTEKKCAPVLENNPRIERIWAMDKAALSNPFKALRYYASVSRDDYDMIIDFQQLPRCKWVVLFSRAPIKLTYTPPWYNRFLYTHWVPMIDGYAAKSKASILRLLDLAWKGESPELFLTDREKAFAGEFATRHGLATPFITVDPSHRRETRRWPESHFAKLIRLLRDRYPSLRAVILYGPGEKPLAERVAELAGEGAIVTESMLSIREMAAVQSLATLHIGNCSAPRHLAVAVGTPSLTIQGATSDGWLFPSPEHISVKKWPKGCPCNENSCRLGTRECLLKLMPEDALKPAVKLIDARLGRPETSPEAE